MTNIISDTDLLELNFEIIKELAPAPDLTAVSITGVASMKSRLKWESIGQGQRTTRLDHGGGFMWVAVAELGYGDNPVAKINGGTLPNSKNVQTVNLCLINGKYKPCSGVRNVVGRILYWDISEYENGIFEYSNSSGELLSDSISIL